MLILEAAAYLWRLERVAPDILTVGVPPGRHPRRSAGVRSVQRERRAPVTVDGLRVTRAAQTVIDLADAPDIDLDDAVALAARACQQGRVTAAALLAELRARGRHRHRRGLLLALGEIDDGAESLPEVWFVTRVQRPHRLPVFERQVLQPGSTRTDLANQEFGVNVEVDGQLWHAGDRFHSDRRRDRLAAGRDEVTLRATFLDLKHDPCQVAGDVARTLRQRGWWGRPVPCSPACRVEDGR